MKLSIHELNILPQYFWAVACRGKCFELRKDDRNFQIGDWIKLCEFKDNTYTGRENENTEYD